MRLMTPTLSGLFPDRASDTRTPFDTNAGTSRNKSCFEYSSKSVVGIAVAFIHEAATPDDAYADVPAPQITAARPCTIWRALLAITRSTVVAHNSGC
jgi:hypothetical protein